MLIPLATAGGDWKAEPAKRNGRDFDEVAPAGPDNPPTFRACASDWVHTQSIRENVNAATTPVRWPAD